MSHVLQWACKVHAIMTSRTAVWLALFAGLGIGSILAAVVGWVSAKAVTISNHRQNWINAIRDDLVEYLRGIEQVHYRVSNVSRGIEPADQALEELQGARQSALLVYGRILLRLNITESAHVRLAALLEVLLHVESPTPDAGHIDAVVTQARQVLKDEWAVTKYGIFTRPVLASKRALRRYFPK